MADSDREVSFDITDWWDSDGKHYEGSPTPDEMLDDARQLTVHAWDNIGNDMHFTTFSHDGWLEDELEADVDDAYEGYAG
jgi:hypothetical protein